VGGIEKTKSSDSTLIGKAIAEVLSHPFGVGNTAYRFATSEPVWVDTVWCGCYKKEIFNRVGLFNEKLLYSQDAEFNFRLRKAGGKILCVPSIIFEYFPRSNLLDFINHKIRDGAWAVIPMRFTRRPMAWRHIVPLFFTSGIIILGILSILFSWIFWIFLILAGFYTAIALSFSIKIAKNKGECRYIYCLPFMFFLLHFFYGLGSIMGMLKLIFRRM
jgi:GT2 family glycosyltransferase